MLNLKFKSWTDRGMYLVTIFLRLHPQILTDHLNLSQPGENIMPTTLNVPSPSPPTALIILNEILNMVKLREFEFNVSLRRKICVGQKLRQCIRFPQRSYWLNSIFRVHLRKAYFCEVPLPLILAELILSAEFTPDFDRRVDLISTREQIIPTTILDTCPPDFHTFLRPWGEMEFRHFYSICKYWHISCTPAPCSIYIYNHTGSLILKCTK